MASTFKIHFWVLKLCKNSTIANQPLYNSKHLYLFKVNYSNFEHISHLSLVFLFFLKFIDKNSTFMRWTFSKLTMTTLNSCWALCKYLPVKKAAEQRFLQSAEFPLTKPVALSFKAYEDFKKRENRHYHLPVQS